MPDPAAKNLTEAGWRQGSVLPNSTHGAINSAMYHQCAGLNDNDVAIVIMHTCALARSGPHVEIVIGRPTGRKRPDKSYLHGKSRKRVELLIEIAGESIVVGVDETDRYYIDTGLLITTSPDRSRILNEDQRESLVEWLVMRYARPAFPDAFDQRVKPVTDVLQNLARQFEKVWRIYVGLSSYEELQDNEDYIAELKFVMKDEDFGSKDVRESTLDLIQQFATQLQSCAGVRIDQDLSEMLVSSIEVTLEDERRMLRWERFDFLSLMNDVHVRDDQ